MRNCDERYPELEIAIAKVGRSLTYRSQRLTNHFKVQEFGRSTISGTGQLTEVCISASFEVSRAPGKLAGQVCVISSSPAE